MTCADHQIAINRFIDHEIKATECADLFEHLGNCAECRQFYDSINYLGIELDRLHSPIEEFAHVAQRQAQDSMYRFGRQKRIAPRPSTLAFVIVLMLVVSLLFSVNVTIEKPTQTLPSEATSQR